MRRSRGILVSVAACALVGCGQSSKATHTTASTIAKPTGVSVSQSMTKAQAVAFARTINLRLSDVPGFRVSPSEKESTSATEKRLEHEMLHCAGAQSIAHKPLAEIKSKEFEREASDGHQSVHSDIEVAPSTKVAAAELAAIRSSRAQACLSHYLRLLFTTMKQRESTYTIWRSP